MKPKIHKNDVKGTQVEWRQCLLTLQANEFHGLSGSLAVRVDGKTILLSFHGASPAQPFPLTYHAEEVLE